MMILRSTPPSPFGRKVRLAASVLGLSGDIKVEPADTNDANDPLRRQNPIGKIPTLVLEDGATLFDSRVILEYLDHRSGGGKIIPNEPKARFAALRLQALADGMTDAQILLVYEGRFRPPEHHVKKWTDYQADKIKRGLDALERDPPTLDPTPNVGQLALAAAKLPVPTEVKLKDPKDFKLIGTVLPRVDTKAKTTGAAQFALDVRLPGMLTAVLARAPLFGATVKSFDPAPAKAVKGVVDVVQISRGVAVVAVDGAGHHGRRTCAGARAASTASSRSAAR